jgi:hypothetical protein
MKNIKYLQNILQSVLGGYKIKELINFENMNLKAEPEIDENGFKNVYQKSLLS